MKQIIEVKGMSCGHCVKAVESEISELDGIVSVKASLDQNNCEVEFDENTVSIEEIKSAILEAGFEA